MLRGTTRKIIMTQATAVMEKAWFTSEKCTFWTGKTKRSMRTFFSKGDALMMKQVAELAESLMNEKRDVSEYEVERVVLD